METNHRLAQRRLSITELILAPGEHLGNLVAMLLWATRFDDDAVFKDAIVDAARPGGNGNAPRGDDFEHGSHLPLNPRGDVGEAAGSEKFMVTPRIRRYPAVDLH